MGCIIRHHAGPCKRVHQWSPEWSPRESPLYLPEIPMKHNADPLTDRRIRSLKAEGRKRVEAMDGAVTGLGVRVLPTGHNGAYRMGARLPRRWQAADVAVP